MRSWMVAAACVAALGASPAWAVFSGDMSPRARSGDADYADAIDARAAKNWAAAVAALDKVVARRPWHDNAHNLLGYSHRKMGNFEKALEHYHIALELNPRHREALEYLGEAYLQMNDLPRAQATLARLGEVCVQVSLTFSDGDFSDGCEEYRELRAAVTHFEATGEVLDDEDE
ncbi:MAG: tetratricopeptide repeat protein [Rubrimonas sp.]|uniref:tetratricopeptide repeat protein n=1 Tax=Rubrimonas sp. TaxID=2036015 RepID=UPI002FDCC103